MKVFYHQGKTGGSFIRQCIIKSGTRCLIAYTPEVIHNSNLKDYEFCYIHGKKSHEIINLLKLKSENIKLFTSIRHPISSFISTVRHARRENNYTLFPLETTMLHGSYTDLKFNTLNTKRASTQGECLNIHQYKIHGAATYLRFLLNSSLNAPTYLERYTLNLSLGNKEIFRHNTTNCNDYLERKAPKLKLMLGDFQYIGLYELFQELLDKLSEEGFLDSNFTKVNELDRYNQGAESDEDEIPEELALKWLQKYPTDFYVWTYLYQKIMSQNHPLKG